MNLKRSIVFCGSYESEIRARTFREVMTLRSKLALEGEILYLVMSQTKICQGCMQAQQHW